MPQNISQITRRNIIDELILNGDIFGKQNMITFLKRIWDLDNMPSTDPRREYNTATLDILQHMEWNNDWTLEQLFYEKLHILNSEDDIFTRFLCELVHPVVRYPNDVDKYVTIINKHLVRDGYNVHPNGEISGYPTFSVVKVNGGVAGKIRNLIFAANGPKPEIIITDALNNEIKIVRNEEYCLVFDLEIPQTGLSWNNLVLWWSKLNGLEKPDHKRTFDRLISSLDSEPERILFRLYYNEFLHLGDSLPALIPQVYLHYDPYTQKELKGIKRTDRQRMDFLLLLPSSERVVIEIDGKQHYSEGDLSSPMKYSEMISADRSLRLKGYEVYRFGGYELTYGDKERLIIDFFTNLFIKHNIIK